MRGNSLLFHSQTQTLKCKNTKGERGERHRRRKGWVWKCLRSSYLHDRCRFLEGEPNKEERRWEKREGRGEQEDVGDAGKQRNVATIRKKICTKVIIELKLNVRSVRKEGSKGHLRGNGALRQKEGVVQSRSGKKLNKLVYIWIYAQVTTQQTKSIERDPLTTSKDSSRLKSKPFHYWFPHTPVLKTTVWPTT